MSSASQPTGSVVSGLDVLVRTPDLVPEGRIGLLTHYAAVTAELGRGVDALRDAGVPLHCLISPEHGYWGTGQAGLGGDETVDPPTGLPVLDSYGRHGEDLDRLLAPARLDRILVDLQDVGCRFYTYMWSMLEVMESAARLGIAVTVLDRPAPLPALAHGPGLDPACASFVGRLSVPLRHGMRLGTFARAVAAGRFPGAQGPVAELDLQVVDAPGADGLARWIAPSPNMPSLETVALYPGTGLLEGTTLSEGRGTTAPFALFGAPWCGPELAAALRDLELPGVLVREAVFRPTHGKHVGERVHGAQVHLRADPREAAADLTAFDPLHIGHAIIRAVARLHPDRPLWRERVDAAEPFIDLLWGSSALREGIEDDAELEEILAASPAPLGAPA
ncbi:exo-beta-N-acetylmuramidase NamZ family protein [Brachybacterium hainanense]|uniref:Exo-beta-N-acetylmuramidase NamZ domain-containing protein n=1 Tax=Brachybacterium hainanense TaxID=1541174 RepID=A0ABV6RCK7_9MICO